MAMKGTDLVKKLPESGKKNCKECGFPTCFAFAMKLASGGATLARCPHLSPDIIVQLEDALSPAIKLVTIGSGDKALPVGNEEIVYRHEKAYLHQPGIALLISDKDDDVRVEQKIRKITGLHFDVVGKTLKADLLALQFESGDKAVFLELVRKVCRSTDLGIILICNDVDVLFSARDICAERKPLLYPVTRDNIEECIPRIKEKPTPVGIRAASVEELVGLTTRLKAEKIDELVLDPGSRTVAEAIRDQTFIRRSAIKHSFRPLGYPTMAFPCFMAGNQLEEMLIASIFVVKFASVIVLSDFDEHTLRPLLTQRLNIYTDPRMPLSMAEKLYAVGEPDENAPVLITTNWALTYFIVSSEIESSKVPSWLLVKEAEGLGVLTAWAAGKFNGDNIAPFVKKSGVE
ncbi:MAG: acetyl-CoA decarbonylase/synthase complex subunit gamma, partial [Chloroflexi bacterium]|nr:acetyl-CoA decarbonylase/synthase complex subunit gamma [Chloroflexota bacterium]